MFDIEGVLSPSFDIIKQVLLFFGKIFNFFAPLVNKKNNNMKNNQLYQQTRSPFEVIKQYDPVNRAEFWYAKELMKLLGYDDWEKFKLVIGRAWHCCNRSLKYMADSDSSFIRETSDRHFYPLLSENLPKGSRVRAERALDNDYKLSRYACYLVAMNASPRYQGVAEIQSYFALTSRIFQEVDRITPILSLPSPSSHLSIKYGLIFVTSTHLAGLLRVEHSELFYTIETFLEKEAGRSMKRKTNYRPEGEEITKGFIISKGKMNRLHFNLTEVGFAKTMVHLRYLYPSLSDKIAEIESTISNDFEVQKLPFLNYVRTVVLPEPQQRKYVYILHNQVTNLYKIGISDNVRRRIMQLTGACGVELQQVFAIKTESANEIEATLHNIFAPYRQEGEWFAIPKDEIDSIASEMQFGVNLLPSSVQKEA